MNKEEYLAEFRTITEKMYETTKAKNSDYTGCDDDPFKNFKMVEQMGVCSAEAGFVTRMTDKLMRISSFVRNGTLEVKDESVMDTLQDQAVYSILMMCYLKSKKQSTHIESLSSQLERTGPLSNDPAYQRQLERVPKE